MRIIVIFIYSVVITACQHKSSGIKAADFQTIKPESYNILDFDSLVNSIKNDRASFRDMDSLGNPTDTINKYWVKKIGSELFQCWAGTGWDFNGHPLSPKKGPIACGYFVTSVITNMGFEIDRFKLAKLPSMSMMRLLTPNQKPKNLSALSLFQFDNKIRESGIGVFVIGLDFHTGFIVNDGENCWFIHSNYLDRKGVTKELIIDSKALESSKTKWLVSISQDRGFQDKWLR